MSNLFVLAVVGGNHIYGRISKTDYNDWFNNRAKLMMENPSLAIIQMVQDKQTRQPVGYHMTLSPVFPEKTRQEKVAFDATIVEILGDIEEDPVSGNSFCKDNSELFVNYQDFVDQWRAEQSGILLPGKNKIITGNEPIQFPRKS